MAPLTVTRLRPSLKRLLEMSTSPPARGNPRASRRSSTPLRGENRNMASTRASLHPVRIRSEAARPPRIRFTAFMMMDFPAPVSPDRILSPGSSSMSSRLMMAKFEILKWTSMPTYTRSHVTRRTSW